MSRAAILQSLHLKATPKRLAILEIMETLERFISADELWAKLKDRFGRIGLPTVYRNLEELCQAGVLMQIQQPDRKLYYYLCSNREHHHHFICTECHRVEDLHYCGSDAIEGEVRQRLKGRVTSHLLQVYGLCEACKGDQ